MGLSAASASCTGPAGIVDDLTFIDCDRKGDLART